MYLVTSHPLLQWSDLVDDNRVMASIWSDIFCRSKGRFLSSFAFRSSSANRAFQIDGHFNQGKRMQHQELILVATQSAKVAGGMLNKFKIIP